MDVTLSDLAINSKTFPSEYVGLKYILERETHSSAMKIHIIYEIPKSVKYSSMKAEIGTILESALVRQQIQ